MMGKNQHVVPNNNRWGVKGEGNKKFSKLFDTKEDAIRYARVIAKYRRSEVIIHDKEQENI
jgi:hypothetical protein